MHATSREAPLTSADVIARTFPGTSFRAGDDQDEVDQHLDVVARALRAWEDGEDGSAIAASSRVAGIAFTRRRLRGYSSAAVDDFLVEVRDVLAGYEAGMLVPPARRHAAPTPALAMDVDLVAPEEVVETSFSMTRFQDGYDCDEVDDFLDACVEAMRGTASMTGADVRAHRFTATRFRDGYAPEEVDVMLERIARTLETPPTR